MSLFVMASRLEKENHAFALLHVVESRGSAPCHAAIMLVREEGKTDGTIGGGMIERLAPEEIAVGIVAAPLRRIGGRTSLKQPPMCALSLLLNKRAGLADNPFSGLRKQRNQGLTARL